MQANLIRPFYFIVVLWGERYRHYFLTYCLPSLLSTRNIPALATQQPSKFLIATRPDDWDAMQKSSIFQMLQHYVAPVYIEIPPANPGTSGIERMSIGHKLACELAHKDKAYATILTPDCMLSDGTISRMQELAERGVQLVLATALRFGEETFLGHLEEMGLVMPDRESATALSLTGRQMVAAALHGFHSETLSYEWGSPYVVAGPPTVPAIPAAWWKVPDEDGIVVHSMSWAPLLLDYGIINRHDSSTLDNWTIDGDYIYKNLSGFEHIHLVQDSDEMFIGSWSPLSDRPYYFKKNGLFYAFLFKHIFGWQFSASFHSPLFDPFKRRIFFQPVRWHSRPLNQRWEMIESQIQDVLCTYVAPPNQKVPLRLRRLLQPSFLLWMGWYSISELRMVPKIIETALTKKFLWMQAVARHLWRALQGDRNALDAVVQKFRRYFGT